jgi:hypothetical protein
MKKGNVQNHSLVMLAWFILLVGCSSKDAIIQLSPGQVDPYQHVDSSARMADPVAPIGGPSGDSGDDPVVSSEHHCVGPNGESKVLLCHKGEIQLCLPQQALRGHMPLGVSRGGHNDDYLGACGQAGGGSSGSGSNTSGVVSSTSGSGSSTSGVVSSTSGSGSSTSGVVSSTSGPSL